MPGPPVSRTGRAESNRAAAPLSNLRGRVSFVKEGYGFIQVERPERASVYAHRSAIVNPRRTDSRNFGLQEGDRVILDIKDSPPQFKVRYQAVRVQLEESDADAAQNSSPSVPASGPKKTEKMEKEIVNQVGTICSVNENGGTLRFGTGNEEFVVFDRRRVPNTLLKPTEKVSEIFSLGNKVGFNARLANTGAGAAQWQATLVTTVLRENTSQVFVFDTEQLTRSTRHDSKKDFGNELTRATSTSDSRAPFQSSQRCPASGASSIRRRGKLPAESGTLVTAASYRPVSVNTNNSSLVVDTNVAPERSAHTATQISSGNGASAVRLHRQLPTKSCTLSAANYLPVSANTSNSSVVFGTSVAPGRSTPTATQNSNGNGASAVRPRCQLSESRTLSAANYLPFSAATSNSSLVYDSNVAAGRSAPTVTQISSGYSASAVQLSCELPTDSRTLSAASLPSPVKTEARNSSLAFYTNAAPTTLEPVATQSSSGNGASVFPPRCQLSTLFRTLSPPSSLSDNAKTEGSNSNPVIDANVSSVTSAPAVMQRSSGATERPEEEDMLAFVPQRCKPRWAFDMARSSTKLDTAAPAGRHPIPAGTDQPLETRPFEKTPRQYIPFATNSHGTDSTSTAVRQQAPRSGHRPPTTVGDRLPTTAGDHKRPARAVSIERVTCQHCGAGEDERELAEVIAEMVTSCLRSVIREEVQALRHEFFGQTGITAGAGDMSSSGHHGSSSDALKAFIEPRRAPLQAVQGHDVATGLRK